MQGTNRPITCCVGDYFQVVRRKIFENDVCLDSSFSCWMALDEVA